MQDFTRKSSNEGRIKTLWSMLSLNIPYQKENKAKKLLKHINGITNTLILGLAIVQAL